MGRTFTYSHHGHSGSHGSFGLVSMEINRVSKNLQVTVFFLLLSWLIPNSAKAAPAEISQAETQCKALFEHLSAGHRVASEWLPIASCLQQAPDFKPSSPFYIWTQNQFPKDKYWAWNNVQQYRFKGDIPKALLWATLAEIQAGTNAEEWLNLADFYAFAAQYLPAGICYLNVLALDNAQSQTIQYSLDNLLRTASVEIPPFTLLDSLFQNTDRNNPSIISALETLCWQNLYFQGAFVCFMVRQKLSSLPFDDYFSAILRFYNAGYDNYAALLFDKSNWEKLGVRDRSIPRLFFLRIHARMQNYSRILSSNFVNEKLETEEQIILAEAYTRSGNSQMALQLADQVKQKTLSPFTFKAKIIIARNQIAQHQFQAAQALLQQIKDDPQRRESSGSVLFWQAFVCLHSNQFAKADSLLVLAASYTGEAETELALHYRYYLLLDTTTSRAAFFHGQPEAPWPSTTRFTALASIPDSSELWPFAQLEMAQIVLENHSPDSAKFILEKVAQKSQNIQTTLKAQAKAAFLEERLRKSRQNTLAHYEDLLIKYQQGVIPEFSRERLRRLKMN